MQTSSPGTVHTCTTDLLIHLSLETRLEQKGWLRPGSPALEVLKELVFDKNLLKDIQQLSLCCHTRNLKVYNSVQTIEEVSLCGKRPPVTSLPNAN